MDMREIIGSRRPTYDEHTIRYYDEHAPSFVADTQQLSLSAIMEEFLSLVPDGGRILDWGCGSGRDSLAMSQLGYEVTATDASEEMCKATERFVGDAVEIRHEAFAELLDTDRYDGIWACSSILHAKPNELPEVLGNAYRALRDGGVMYCSFKRGHDMGYRHGRWFTDMDADELGGVLTGASFEVIRIWVTSDVRRGREGELWVNALSRKVATE